VSVRVTADDEIVVLCAEVLTEVAKAFAATGNTAQAQEVAETITTYGQRAWALAEVAKALAATGNTTQAREVAEGITNDRRRAEALAEVAKALGATGDAIQAQEVAEASPPMRGGPRLWRRWRGRSLRPGTQPKPGRSPPKPATSRLRSPTTGLGQRP
jgi:hypothetical protein